MWRQSKRWGRVDRAKETCWERLKNKSKYIGCQNRTKTKGWEGAEHSIKESRWVHRSSKRHNKS